MKTKAKHIPVGFAAAALSIVAAASAAAVNVASVKSAAETSLKNVEALWEAAKAGKDMIKFNCVNDILSTMRGTILVLSGATENYTAAVEKKDEKDIAHEASKISIAQNTIKQAEAAAKACKGEVARFTGTTEKSSEVDPGQTGASFTDKTTSSNITSVPTESGARPNATSPM